MLRAGLAITPGALTSAVASIAAGKLIKRQHLPVAIAVALVIFGAIGLWLRFALGPRPEFLAVWLPAGAIGGAAFGFALTALSTVAALAVPPVHFASGTALNVTGRQVGGSLGVAATAAISSAVVGIKSPLDVFLFAAVAAFAAALAAFGLAWVAGAAARTSQHEPGARPTSPAGYVAMAGAAQRAREGQGGPREGQGGQREDNAEARLVGVARSVFAEYGYAEASLSSIVAAAGLTKGAVYYYFRDKQDLFRAVYLAEQQRLLDASLAASQNEEGPWEAFHSGIRAFIRGLRNKAVQRIILIDAPVALGWDALRAAAFPSGLRMIRDGLGRVADAGLLAPDRVDLLASFLYGVVREAAHYIGDSAHPDEVIEPVLTELHGAIDRLRTGAR